MTFLIKNGFQIQKRFARCFVRVKAFSAGDIANATRASMGGNVNCQLANVLIRIVEGMESANRMALANANRDGPAAIAPNGR